MKKSILSLAVVALLASSVVTSCKKKDESVTPSNKSPYVSITYPKSTSSFSTKSNVSIYVEASDPDGTISKVEFYDGSTLLGTETKGYKASEMAKVASDTLTYYVSKALSAGSHTLTAKAYDNANASTTSTAVTITVTEPIVVVPVVVEASKARK
jgi:chitinase